MLIRRQFNDIDEFSELTREWDLDFRQTQAGELQAALVQHVQPDLQFAFASFSHCVTQRGLSPGVGRTFALLDRVSPLEWCRQAVDGDTLMAFDPSGSFESISAPGFSVFTLTIPEATWQAALDRIIQWRDRNDLCEPTLFRARPELVHQLRQRLRAYRCHILGYTWTGSNTVIDGTDCIDELFGVIDDDPRSRTYPGDRSAPRRVRALSRAREFIEASGGEKVTVAKLCEATGVSERTLQYAFREHTGQSPKSYIRSYRLDRVRHALRQADGETVGEIARRWGFHHLGQFARYYRQQFGELPSVTAYPDRIEF